jgi:hypothetical protein
LPVAQPWLVPEWWPVVDLPPFAPERRWVRRRRLHSNWAALHLVLQAWQGPRRAWAVLLVLLAEPPHKARVLLLAVREHH